ncbi:MAG TPA: alpha-glucosidase [Verrucomicrobiae bacterium]|nr:alpha-glucosidase [Verrucomicrobiae bacterium]
MPRRSFRIAVFAILWLSLPAIAQQSGRDAEGHAWWQHAVFYEIYPRSFADSNNDGIGDLPGITSRLDYLHWLGVDALWIAPMYPSPEVDWGYDVSDYFNVNPDYGTLADMDRLVGDARQQKIRILLDFVLTYTSDQNKWFQQSRLSRTNPKRDWYIWRDGKEPGQPPNNWTSLFGGSAWKFDAPTDQWYYHYFYPPQPNLNWRNPEVEKAMFDVTRWWYKRGIAGFRLDAVDVMFVDSQFRDNPVVGTEKNALGDPVEREIYDKNQPEIHGVLERLRKVADDYNAVLIGETWTSDIAQLKRYYGQHDDEIQMPMDFMFTMINQLSPAKFRQQIAWAEGSGEWPVWVLSNHDIRRVYDRYGDGQHNDQIAKLMASLYLTLRGTAVMYYGEEIGMENNDPKRPEDVKDSMGKLGWPKEKGRDGERTPMQWNDTANAGFSSVAPWLPVDDRYRTYNVATEKKDPHSILNYYHQLLTLRHENQALLEGKYVALDENDPNVLAYARSYKGTNVVVLLNMSASPQKVDLDLAGKGIAGKTGKTLLASFDAPEKTGLNQVSIEPFGAWIVEVE